MIGNDIVDLETAALESNWKRRGYLDKLFTATEQQLIHNTDDADQMVWLLWSMKESAYKIWSRLTGLREFAPVKINCGGLTKEGNKVRGNVNYHGYVFYTETTLAQNHLHTTAAFTKIDLAQIRVSISTNVASTTYKKSKPGSVSHHGKYLALAYL